MKYVMGIDSGGTKFLVCVQNLSGENIAKYQGPSATDCKLSPEEAITRINENIDACLSKFSGRREECAYMVVGTAGLDHPEDQKIIDDLYNGLSGFKCPIYCVNDAVIAHETVTGGIGAIVVAGTGSIAFGRNSEGKEARCGGWPLIIFGEEGSGTWISLQAFRHLSTVFDGREEKSLLSEKIQQKLCINKGKDLVSICMDIENGRWVNPGLPCIVDEAAAEGDEAAIRILRGAARCTFSLADSIITRLSLEKEHPFIVGAWGSAIVKSPLHMKFYSENLKAKYPHVEVRTSEKDAAEGACRMALERLKQSV